jgi:hypothetical protein
MEKTGRGGRKKTDDGKDKEKNSLRKNIKKQ